jgi:uncharacterized C2H2 Zn-finger protein
MYPLQVPTQNRGVSKIRQTVWLSLKAFQRVLELSEKLNLAPNVVISLIVESYFKALDEGKISSTSDDTKSNQEQVKVFLCPSCLKEFRGVQEFIKHVASDPEHLQQFVSDRVKALNTPRKPL